MGATGVVESFQSQRVFRTEVMFAELLTKYLLSRELACIPRLLARGILILKHLRCYIETTGTKKNSYQYNKFLRFYCYQYFDYVYRSTHYI